MQQQQQPISQADGAAGGAGPRKRSSSGELDAPAKRPSGDGAPRSDSQVRVSGRLASVALCDVSGCGCAVEVLLLSVTGIWFLSLAVETQPCTTHPCPTVLPYSSQHCRSMLSQVCAQCGETNTPTWRRAGGQLLCNACGLRRYRAMARSDKKKNGASPSPAADAQYSPP